MAFLGSFGEELSRIGDDLYRSIVPEMPDVPKAPSSEELAEDEAMQAARLRDAQAARESRRQGAASTILTSPLGTQSRGYGSQILLGR